jgi:hypothetical protein
MSQNGYDGKITLAAGVTRLVTALIAAGYTGRFGFTRANLRNETGDLIYFARRADVDASTGRPLESQRDHEFPKGGGFGSIDMNQMYVFSVAGGDAYFSGQTR